MSERLYLVAAKRTPLGRFLGALCHYSAVELGSHAARAALQQSGIDGGDLDAVILGQSLPAGQHLSVARQTSLAAAIADDIPASSVNMGSLSGLKALIDACTQLKAGDGDLILTIASESASNTGFLHPAQHRHGLPSGHFTTLDLLLHDAQHTGQASLAERAEYLARRYRLSRDMQDAFVQTAQQNAVNAQENGHFVSEIAALDIHADQLREWPAEQLAKLPAVHGSISNGNRAALADGASAILVATESALRRFNLVPLAEVLGYGLGGGAAELGALAAVPAIAQALERSDCLLQDIERLEIEETFAAETLAILHELAEQHDTTFHHLSERLNPSGGALALGHPLACAGHRLVTTLCYGLARANQSLGLAAQGSGDGQGAAIILARPVR